MRGGHSHTVPLPTDGIHPALAPWLCGCALLCCSALCCDLHLHRQVPCHAVPLHWPGVHAAGAPHVPLPRNPLRIVSGKCAAQRSALSGALGGAHSAACVTLAIVEAMDGHGWLGPVGLGAVPPGGSSEHLAESSAVASAAAAPRSPPRVTHNRANDHRLAGEGCGRV